MGRLGEFDYYIRNVRGLNVVVVTTFYFIFVPFKSHTTTNHIVKLYNAGYGYCIIQNSVTKKLAIRKPNNQYLTKFVFDEIIGFHHSSENYNKVHAIGFIGDRVYEILMDGYIDLLHISKNDYLSMKHRYDEMLRKRINLIIENLLRQINNRNTILENNNTEIQNTMKQTIRLTESQLRNAIRQMIKEALNETDYKTALWAAKERMKRYDQTHDKKDFEQGYNDYRAADERFRDKYVTPYQYDTLGDKMRGKHSSTFDVRFNGGSEDPTHSLRAYNKGGDKLEQSEKNNYHSSKGYTTPSKFFRDKDVADAYQKASDELWDYSDGKYEYVKGNGWQRKDD